MSNNTNDKTEIVRVDEKTKQNRNQLYVVYQKPTLNIKTQVG